METLNIKAVEMENKSTKSNNVTMGNIEELTKVFKQEEKELNRLIKGKRNDAVIAAQQKVVDEAKAQMEQAQEFERISKEKAVNSSFTFSVVDEETGARTEQQKKIAFVKNNRPVSSKKVDGFMALIAANKYDKALKGEEITFPNGVEIKIERGNNFINLCKAANMSVSFITKRYFIKDFNSYAKSTSEEQAFEALNKLKELNYTEKDWKEVKEENDFIEILKKALEA